MTTALPNLFRTLEKCGQHSILYYVYNVSKFLSCSQISATLYNILIDYNKCFWLLYFDNQKCDGSYGLLRAREVS